MARWVSVNDGTISPEGNVRGAPCESVGVVGAKEVAEGIRRIRRERSGGMLRKTAALEEAVSVEGRPLEGQKKRRKGSGVIGGVPAALKSGGDAGKGRRSMK